MKPEQQRMNEMVPRLVANTCKDVVKFKSTVQIQGLIGITVDGQDSYLIHIDEHFPAATHAQPGVKDGTQDAVSVKKSGQRQKIPGQGNVAVVELGLRVGQQSGKSTASCTISKPPDEEGGGAGAGENGDGADPCDVKPVIPDSKAELLKTIFTHNQVGDCDKMEMQGQNSSDVVKVKVEEAASGRKARGGNKTAGDSKVARKRIKTEPGSDEASSKPASKVPAKTTGDDASASNATFHDEDGPSAKMRKGPSKSNAKAGADKLDAKKRNCRSKPSALTSEVDGSKSSGLTSEVDDCKELVSTETAYICLHPGCGKRFAYKQSLLHHQTTAHGRVPKSGDDGNMVGTETAYICMYPGCEKRFKYRQSLLHHQTVQHGRMKASRTSKDGDAAQVDMKNNDSEDTQ